MFIRGYWSNITLLTLFKKKLIKTKEMCQKYGEDDLPQGLPHEQKNYPKRIYFHHYIDVD
ncbi:hypothetical protein vBKpnSMK54_52 [Klebsiella phage vB_KpnS_MK54]|uniref:hypothetical protein n=1 Tax=Klebsiella phage vB_KpnS_MK54 TaxID=2783667 RepID=UPI001CE62393|nr:hypothetical protein PRB83_gp52 [Klebsiella phage vB_KpnS_MK54]QZD26094.1 hypothetical protein vBKpnSMK54_52 [Klebsiella phage vB_KpnS_MK54]